MAKSYHLILGITPQASAKEVKHAYRRLAKEYHPDGYSGNREVFNDIQEAYSVLGNPGRRQAYERQLAQRQHRASTVRGGATGREPEPLIPAKPHTDIGTISPVRSFQTFSPSREEIFDWLWQNFATLGQPKSSRLQDLTMEIPLTPEQARTGGTARVMVPARAVCPTCNGYGGVGPYACSRCAGEGEISGEVPVSIAFPAGIAGDHAVVLSLRRFGISDTRLTVLFRTTDSDWV